MLNVSTSPCLQQAGLPPPCLTADADTQAGLQRRGYKPVKQCNVSSVSEMK